MIHEILIPTDGSEYSATAIEYGMYLASVFKARLTGLSIIDLKIIQGPLFDDISGFMGISPAQECLPLIERGLNERADGILSDFEERCKKAGLTPVTKKITGIVDEVIIREGEKADLILLAQRGEHYPFARSGLLGSTSEAVVRKAGKPVLITPFTFREIRRVGLACDGSTASDRALHMAAGLCRETDWPLSALFVTGNRERAEQMKRHILSSADCRNVACSVTVRDGKEEQEIIHFTKEGTIDLLVMGAYGHSRIRELILGSTTSYVIRKSEIPVLMVR